MDDLTQRVQDLPPELFNKIYDLVFTANYATIDVTKQYRPPHLLHVSKHSRQMFAKSYYGEGTVFVFRTPGPHHMIKKWTQTLRGWSHHINMLHEVHVVHERTKPLADDWPMKIAHQIFDRGFLPIYKFSQPDRRSRVSQVTWACTDNTYTYKWQRLADGGEQA